MLISFSLLQLSNSFYTSLGEERRDGETQGAVQPCSPGTCLYREQATSYTSHFKKHCCGSFRQQTTYFTNKFVFLWKKSMAHQIYISS